MRIRSKSLLEFLIIVGVAITNAAFFFMPSFPLLGQDGDNWYEQIYEAFFHTGNPEVLFGEGVDPYGSFWIVTKVREMLFGDATSFMDGIYSPLGFDLGLHEGFAWGDTILAIPWELLIGSPGFYNIHVFQTLCLSFIGCVYLSRVIGASLPISLVIAHLTTIHSFTISELSLGRPTQVYWIFQCIFLIAIIKIFRNERSWFWSVIAGVFFAWSCLVYWFGAIALGGCVMLLYIIQSILAGPLRERIGQGLIILSLSVVLCLMVTSRVSIPILFGETESYAHFIRQPDMYLNFFFFYVPLLDIYDCWSLEHTWNLFRLSTIPWTIWVLSFLTFFVGIWNKKTRLYAVFPLLAASITLGAAIRIQGIIFPTLYSFLHTIFPPIVRCTELGRMMNATALFSLVGISMILVYQGRMVRYFVQSVLCLLLLINIMLFPTEAVQTTQKFTKKVKLHELIAQDKGGIIDVPLDRSDEEFVQQLWHGQPIFGGPGVAMLRSELHLQYEQNNLFLTELYAFDKNIDSIELQYSTEDIQQLMDDGFLYVVIHEDFIQRRLRDYTKALHIQGIYIEQEHILVVPLQDLI